MTWQWDERTAGSDVTCWEAELLRPWQIDVDMLDGPAPDNPDLFDTPPTRGERAAMCTLILVCGATLWVGLVKGAVLLVRAVFG